MKKVSSPAKSRPQTELLNSGLDSSESSVVDAKMIVATIRQKLFWQGSLLPGEELSNLLPSNLLKKEWWVVASQTCNLWNDSLEKVPHVELIAAQTIPKCSSQFSKGSDPRTLHVEATSQDFTQRIFLEVSILDRCWIPREVLAQFTEPKFMLLDKTPIVSSNAKAKPSFIDWADRFSGWMGRSYTRIALPDEFNIALKKSRLGAFLSKKLTDGEEDIFGLYLSVNRDEHEEWKGRLGLMPGPYLLELLVVVQDNVDAHATEQSWISALNAEISLSPDSDAKTTLLEMSNQHNIRISDESIMVRTMSGASLADLKGFVRYSMSDYLSNAEMASPQSGAV